MDEILAELAELEPFVITLPEIPGHHLDKRQAKFEHLYQQLQRFARLKQHHQVLYTAYYLGKLIEHDTRSHQKK